MLPITFFIPEKENEEGLSHPRRNKFISIL